MCAYRMKGWVAAASKYGLPSLVVAIVASTLPGCGGGHGSDGGSNIDTSAQLVVSPTQLSVSAQTADPAPTAIIQVTVQATSATGTQSQYYISGSETRNGIDSVASAAAGSADDLTVTFKSPATLAVGTYTDTITLMGCDDQACTRPISGSPQTVSVTYTVTQTLPQVTSLNPASTTAGAPSFPLTVYGLNFVAQSVVQWNGTAVSTAYVSANQLTAEVSAPQVSASGTYSVTVSNGNGAISSASAFTVMPLAQLSLGSISPTQVTAGGSNFILTAMGTGFASTSSIVWNNTSLATTYVSDSELRAPVTAAQIASVGTVAITVSGSASQASSSPLNLTIIAPTVDAVAYQMNPAHTGAVAFKTLTLPTGSAWSVDVGGNPSYALIVGGQVYVTVAVNGNSQLLALNGSTGATLWGPIAFTGNVNAAYDRGQLFVVSGGPLSQIVTALDAASGNSVWSAALNGSWYPQPPVATAGIVYTTDGGVVTALDETNGTNLWETDISGTSGIVAVTVDAVYGAAPCTAVSLQPALGTQLWSNNSGCEGGGGATPVAANGLMYAPENSAGSSGTIFDAETGTLKGNYSADVIPAFSASAGFFLSSGTLQGLAIANNQVLWSFAGDGQLATAPIVVNNYVFIGSASGNLYALDASSGQQVWTNNLGVAIPPNNEYGLVIYTGLSAGDGLLVVPNGTKVTAFVLSTSP